ncbi:hypothetical protein AA313_de0202863 [Arthrobotrys entomopaga]|nr:hypothetical protein AA313_de0202863 [Arthrobotrys entomopaga]
MEEGYDLFKNIDPTSSAIHFQTCLALGNKLLAWRQEWNVTYGVEPYTYTVPTISIPFASAIDEHGPIFDTLLFYKNVSICTTVYHYDQFIIILAGHLQKFLPWFELYFGDHDPLCLKVRQLIAACQIDMTLREIARSIDYQRSPEFQHGSTGLFFGARCAWDLMNDRQSRVGRFLERAVVQSPLMRRCGLSRADEMMQLWYGPNPPTAEDILKVQAQRMVHVQAYVTVAEQEQPLLASALDMSFLTGALVVGNLAKG